MVVHCPGESVPASPFARCRRCSLLAEFLSTPADQARSGIATQRFRRFQRSGRCGEQPGLRRFEPHPQFADAGEQAAPFCFDPHRAVQPVGECAAACAQRRGIGLPCPAAPLRIGAIVLDGAVVKKHGFVGAGALVAPGKVVGEGELWLGNPAKKVRMLSDAEIEALYYSAGHYVRLKDEYLAAAPAS